jgi:hypothetical protein
MWRIMVGLAAWTAGTVIAVSVAWLGANVVVRNAGGEPGMPVVSAALLPSAAPSPTPPLPVTRTPLTKRPAAGPEKTTPAPAGTGSARPGTRPANRASAPAASATAASATAASATAAATAGDVKAYTLAGGRVTLDMANGTVQLVTAVPNAGYSVQTWSGTGWLRVDFSSGPQVSSLIASWYQHAPTVTVTN